MRFSELCIDVYACASYIKKSSESTDVSTEPFKVASDARGVTWPIGLEG